MGIYKYTYHSSEWAYCPLLCNKNRWWYSRPTSGWFITSITSNIFQMSQIVLLFIAGDTLAANWTVCDPFAVLWNQARNECAVVLLWRDAPVTCYVYILHTLIYIRHSLDRWLRIQICDLASFLNVSLSVKHFSYWLFLLHPSSLLGT